MRSRKNRKHASSQSRPRKKKGIILLVVLSLLALFMVLVTTFLIAASQYHLGARGQATVDRVGDSPNQLLDRAMYQALRGNPHGNSSVVGHDLLGDKIGNDHLDVFVAAGSARVANGMFWRIPFTTATGTPNLRPNAYAGRVASLLKGPQAISSSRVVAYAPAGTGTPPGPWILVEAFQHHSGDTTLPAVGDIIRINGGSFNGTGAGYDTSTGNLDASITLSDSTDGPLALFPHFRAYPLGANANRGGADESYDVPDYQNMFLAMVPPAATSYSDIIPSFHRPALINYWRANKPSMWTNEKDFRRAIVMRPMGWDHPNFTGGNDAMADSRGDVAVTNALINGPWDIDNDADGITDSIWLDVGFPAQMGPNGRMMKPLAAILIKDLDGRLHLNAHGHYYQQSGAYAAGGNVSQTTGAYAGGAGTATLPRGAGYGPAEVYLDAVFSNTGITNNILSGRYDHTGISGADASQPKQPGVTHVAGVQNGDDELSRLKEMALPSAYGAQTSAWGSAPDVWGMNAIAVDFRGLPYTNRATDASQVYYQNWNDDPYEIDLSSVGVSGSTSNWDRPYTVAELERLLRWRDYDSPTLPQRLVELGGGDFNNTRRRESVTTESRYDNSPQVQVPYELRTTNMRSNPQFRTIMDLYAERLSIGGFSGNVALELEKIIPVELRKGEPFDVNRFFGDGRDNNGNNVVDEPIEADTGENTWGTPNLSSNMANFASAFNYDNGDPLITRNGNPNQRMITLNRYTRQIYARHLYCLMMLMVENGYKFPTTQAGLTAQQQEELTARRIAQWAINAVDFRDPDCIMSPFEYDYRPFNANGWDPEIDGNPATPLANADGRIVWGAESPDLLITETAAFHDRAVKDTPWDTNGEERKKMMGGMWVEDDLDLDQFRIPKGSLFLELLNVRNIATAANEPNLPAELYNGNALHLGRLAPASGGKQHPVWRIAITEMKPPTSIRTESIAFADTTQFAQPDPTINSPWARVNSNSFLPAVDAPRYTDIERIIWFTNQRPSNLGHTRAELDGANGGKGIEIFYDFTNRNMSPLPGQYAVVGPRTTTHFGGVKSTMLPRAQDSPRILRLNPTTVQFSQTFGGDSQYPTDEEVAFPMATMVAAADFPWGDGAGGDGDPTNQQITPDGGIGVNISEPLPHKGYYRRPTRQAVTGGPYDSYYDAALMTADIPDQPFDDVAGRPLNDHGMQNTGTYTDVRTALLQRLADPTQAWHYQINPYVTVDWATIDLTVFNGEDDERPSDWPADADWQGGTAPTFDLQGGEPNGRNVAFRTRERGNSNKLFPNLWSPVAQFDNADQPWPLATAADQSYFRRGFKHTIGFINRNVADAVGGETYTKSGGTAPANYRGNPKVPFPWLAWLDRPFATPYELMLVPSSSPSRMGFEVTNSADNTNSPYTPDTAPNDAKHFHAPFRHLLNFYQTSPVVAAGNPSSPAANLYRVFDYMETRSPFVGVEEWYRSDLMSTGGIASPPSATYMLQPPFNRMSRHRDPGRINLNTLYDIFVWEGISFGYPAFRSATVRDNVALSRQGYLNKSIGLLTINNAYPTRFCQPFRSSGSSDLAPLLDPNVASFGGRADALRTTGVEAGMLRSHPTDPTRGLFDASNGSQYANTNRNPYFRYQGLSRMGNIVSTNSNVFAMWVTIGYFEVQDVARDNVHPDGYSLGAEVGLDSGEIKRHRAFYIIDRSIPVAYEEGVNHNVDRAILLRRYIE